jgi:membrane-associated phospholipid phosphatase
MYFTFNYEIQQTKVTIPYNDPKSVWDAMVQYRVYTMKRYFLLLLKNSVASFRGYNAAWHIIAITLTYILVVSGFDQYYFLAMREPVISRMLAPAIPIGGLVPILLPAYLLLSGSLRRDTLRTHIGIVLSQAAILGSVISSTYKAFTGRIQPDLHNTAIDISNSFNFGFWEHGIFWGWPSSHTTIAFAMVFSLVTLFRSNKIIRYSAITYAFYIGIGISTSIHWFSDFVAGAIIGTVIGITVGRSFADR